MKMAFGGHSRHSREESSSQQHVPDKPEEVHVHEEGEPDAPQGQSRIEDEDAPYLDLEGDREIQAYNHVKDRIFLHTPLYNPELLQKTGMESEFEIVWKAVGWETIDPMDEEGSRLLTIQFLCSLQEDQDGIIFRLFEQQYFVTWKDLSLHLGFNRKCATEIDHAMPHYNRNQFWEEISGRVEFGTFKPHNSQIQHPT